MISALPIDGALTAIIDAVATKGRLVLTAEPGAGKTTRVPLGLLSGDFIKGRILMLEPRRLAARAAAERMAETLGEPVGKTIGYRMRGDVKTSPSTQIEVVTEGILTRMIQSDPELKGIGAVIFDEFHERSLNADLGLALVWDIRKNLRPELHVIIMSATLEAAPIAALLDDAPIISVPGRDHPVSTHWLSRPPDRSLRYEAAAAELIEEVAKSTDGGVLVFLPGEGEIRHVENLLKGRLPAESRIMPLYGALDFATQRKVMAPLAIGRKVVLATAIAETSLTIEGIRVVVDCGRARRARFDPASAMQRLVTERVTRAEAEQRQGRAGRQGPGKCFRMWTKGEEGGMAAHPPAEIEAADLCGLALELAAWGTDGEGMAFLTPPPGPAILEARVLLTALGAIDAAGQITAHGRALGALPLHPRLGHMLVKAGPKAAILAALLAERDPLRGASADLTLRMAAIADPQRFATEHGVPVDRAAVERIRIDAKRLEALVEPVTAEYSLAEMAALAYPDRIGLRRKSEDARFLLSGGKGAFFPEGDPMARATLIVATDLDGDPREAKVRQAVVLDERELRRLFSPLITWTDRCEWSRRDSRITVRRQQTFGALVLDERPWTDVPKEAMTRAAIDGVRQLGLTFSDAARRYRARVDFLRREGAELPDFTDKGLLERAEEWLSSAVAGKKTAAELCDLNLLPALKAALSHEQRKLIDALAPADFATPLGRSVPIDYEGEHPAITVRLQELFGTLEHPTVGPKRLPLRITLLSPAQNPVQVTLDLPGFWASSYADVRRDMRGQYPKHPWPEDPTVAEPTLRAKPRKS